MNEEVLPLFSSQCQDKTYVVLKGAFDCAYKLACVVCICGTEYALVTEICQYILCAVQRYVLAD